MELKFSAKTDQTFSNTQKQSWKKIQVVGEMSLNLDRKLKYKYFLDARCRRDLVKLLR